MTLRLYNTLTRAKEPFAPLDAKNVRMYVCGPTVYDYAHIGNARPAIVFDVLFRLLRHVYGVEHVTYVRNITDIDDKINARALELRGDRNVDVLDVVRELTERTYAAYQQDVEGLGNLTPSMMPRATEHVPQMIAMIRVLIDAGLAYEADGHVLFDVAKKPDYGKLSRRPLEEMIAGARVDVAPYKREAVDFVLWKPSDDTTPGWDSPWGRGRPGWHLECSSMIEATMGDTIDIHGGGIDLVFPHHENEIAQSEGAHRGHALARVWMHNGFLNVEGEKMSKSLGNFVTIHELLETDRFGHRRWKGDLVRFAMLQTHYRQPIDWTVTMLEQSESRFDKWRLFASERTGNRPNKKFFDSVIDDLADDLNTPKAFARIDQQIGQSEDPRDPYTVYKLMKLIGLKGPTSDALRMAKAASQMVSYLTALSEDEWRSLLHNVGRNPLLTSGDPKSSTRLVAGLGQLRSVLNNIAYRTKTLESLPDVRALQQQSVDTVEIARAIEARNAARAAKNFKESDRIRDELLAQGIQLKDGLDGTTWEVKR